MEKEVERKISLMHAAFGFLAGVVSGLYKAQVTLQFLHVLFFGLVIAYPLMLLSRRLFNLSEQEFRFKDWLAKGFSYFFLVWILVWSFVHNIR